VSYQCGVCFGWHTNAGDCAGQSGRNAAPADELEAIRRLALRRDDLSAELSEARAELVRVTAERDEARDELRELTDVTHQAVEYLRVFKGALYECCYCGATRDEKEHRPGCQLDEAASILGTATFSVTRECDDARAQLATLEARVERAKSYLIDVMAHSALCRREGLSGRGCHVCALFAILEGDTE
jgi:DNA repair exonuclease SbcCD ATPase subunit